MSKHVQNGGRPARLAAWASLAVAAAGLLLFGSVVGAVGEWMEGRQIQTVAPWAIPGLVLATVAGFVAIRTLLTGKGHRLAVLVGLAVVMSVVLLFLVNPSTAPPVPEDDAADSWRPGPHLNGNAGQQNVRLSAVRQSSAR